MHVCKKSLLMVGIYESLDFGSDMSRSTEETNLAYYGFCRLNLCISENFHKLMKKHFYVS